MLDNIHVAEKVKNRSDKSSKHKTLYPLDSNDFYLVLDALFSDKNLKYIRTDLHAFKSADVFNEMIDNFMAADVKKLQKLISQNATEIENIDSINDKRKALAKKISNKKGLINKVKTVIDPQIPEKIKSHDLLSKEQIRTLKRKISAKRKALKRCAQKTSFWIAKQDKSTSLEDAKDFFYENPVYISYLMGNTTFKSLKNCDDEYESRQTKTNELDHRKLSDRSRHILRLIYSEQATPLPSKLSVSTLSRNKHGVEYDINASGLNLRKELRRYIKLKKDIQAQLGTAKMRALASANYARNANYKTQTRNNDLVLKVIDNKQYLRNEIVAKQMCDLAGLGEIVLPCQSVKLQTTSLSNSGNLTHSPLFLDKKHEKLVKVNTKKDENKDFEPIKVLAQPFLEDSESGLDILLRLLTSVEEAQQAGYFSAIRMGARCKAHIDTLNGIEQSSLEKNILKSYLLGDGDCNPGNTLFLRKKGKLKIYSIDHEVIMPEDNISITKKIPVIMEGKLKFNGKFKEVPVTKDIAVPDVYPIRCWLLGLPNADKPFTEKTLRFVLKNIHPEAFKKFHTANPCFSQEAVDAQIKRIRLMRKLFRAELKKNVITLSPRGLFLETMKKHPSYTILKDQFNLPTFILFQHMGYVPANIADDEIKEKSEKLDHLIQKNNTIFKVIRHRCMDQSIPKEFEDDPDLFATITYQSLTETSKQMKAGCEVTVFYEFAHGKEKPKVDRYNDYNPMPNPFFFNFY